MILKKITKTIVFQGPEISVNSEGPVMIYKKYFDKEDVIMKVLCFRISLVYLFCMNHFADSRSQGRF